MANYLEQGEVEPERAARAVREGAARRPPRPDLLRLGAHRRRRRRAARRLRQAAAEPDRRQSAAVPQGRRRDARAEFRAEPDPTKHVLAHVFKVMIDPFVGKLGVFRVHQGTITRDTQLFIGDGRKPFKVGHLFMLQGKEARRDRRARARATSPRSRRSTRSSSTRAARLARRGPHPPARRSSSRRRCTALAIEPKRRGDEQRISEVLHKLVAEDPDAQASSTTPRTNETVSSGLGDLHLRYILERMPSAVSARSRHAAAAHSLPRDDHARKAEGHHRHKKQTGGAGQFGEVFLRVEPLTRGAGFEFVDAVKGGVDPDQFIPAVREGRASRCSTPAPIAGYPVQDVRVTVYDGKHHPRRLQGSRVRLGRPQGVHGRDREGAADRARADRQRRDHRAGAATWATSPATFRRGAARSPAPNVRPPGTVDRERPGAAGGARATRRG